MTKFAQGLKLAISDRDAFEQFINDTAFDPGVHYDSWGQNAIPEAIYIVSFQAEEDDESYYKCIDQHVNGVTTRHYYGEFLLDGGLDEEVLEKDGYDVEFVEENQ